MYLKQVIENRESWWGYVLTVILIVPIAVFLLSIPHAIILSSKAFGDEELMAKIASGDMASMMSVLEPNLNLFLMLLPFVGMLLAVFFSTKIIHKNTILELTNKISNSHPYSTLCRRVFLGFKTAENQRFYSIVMD